MQDTNSINSAYPDIGQTMADTTLLNNRNIFSGGGKTFKEDYFAETKPSKYSVFTPPVNNQITRAQSSNKNGIQSKINDQTHDSIEYS